MINNAGRNNRTHVFEISLDEDSFKRLYLEAIAPYPIVSSTATEACNAPTKLGRMPLDIMN